MLGRLFLLSVMPREKEKESIVDLKVLCIGWQMARWGEEVSLRDEQGAAPPDMSSGSTSGCDPTQQGTLKTAPYGKVAE